MKNSLGPKAFRSFEISSHAVHTAVNGIVCTPGSGVLALLITQSKSREIFCKLADDQMIRFLEADELNEEEFTN